jgi:UDP-N-acetylglucosamine--N-acetylmuramyl-(pentapeptide) pyrophosphoryl-undecaprenol N-acetylglucosamine transferase
MKFVFTGAGGGHFYPLIAVAESIRAEVYIKSLPDPEFFFLSDDSYDTKALESVRMQYLHVPAGKLRLYFSFENFTDVFKTGWGIIVAFFRLYIIYPDVIFAKGGYASFPVLFAARLLAIPVIIHESDSVAGRVTKWAGKFADKIAISQEGASSYFDEKKVAVTGQPLRLKLTPPFNYKKKEGIPERPLLLILGGSQGSSVINDVMTTALPELLNYFDVVHQTGKDHAEAIKILAESVLLDHKYKNRYFASGFIDLSLYYPKADIIVSRAGSTTLFESAIWQIPSLVIPIPQTISRDQTKNAYTFASLGTCLVIEETNLSKNIIITDLRNLIENKVTYSAMSKAGEKVNYSRDASLTIAKEMLRIAHNHL